MGVNIAVAIMAIEEAVQEGISLIREVILTLSVKKQFEMDLK